MSSNNTEKKLYNLLTTRNFDNFEVFDSKTSRPPIDPVTGQENVSLADMYKFNWSGTSGHNYGTAVILLTADGNLEIYFGDNLGRSMEAEDKTEWYDFLHQLKNFATKNFKSFSPKNLNQLRYTMQGQAAIKEGLFESWTGTRTTSWNGKPTEARLMIRHKRPLDETDARFRYVESLFVETAEGERYKLPFIKLSGGRAMLEHVRQGGQVYDARGQHIAQVVEELNVLSRFRRASTGKIFEGDTADLVEQTNAYYESAQKTLKNLSNARGYTAYFESWNQTEMTEQEVVIEGLKHLFVTQSIDHRIEEALPILARIQQQENAMKEANIFEAWANQLMEGTWALPDTAEQQTQLVKLLSEPFTVGADATNATEQLYDLIGDDELFDQLESLADTDPDADAREVVIARLEQLSGHPEVEQVLAQLNQNREQSAEETAPDQVDEADTMSLENAQPEVVADFSLEEGSVNHQMHKDAERMTRAAFVERYGDEHGEFWDNIMGELDEGRSDFPDETEHEYNNRQNTSHMEESPKNPATQTEDPAGTLQPEYGPYGEDLEAILKAAGVDDTTHDAPDYETGINEAATRRDFRQVADLIKQIPDEIKKRELAKHHADIFVKMNPRFDHDKFYKYIGIDEGVVGSVLGRVAGAMTPIPGGSMIGGAIGDAIGDAFGTDSTEQADEAENLSPFTEETCNMSEAGTHCNKHGMDECYGSDDRNSSPLRGQYGHSGKMQAVDNDSSFLDRLKELSGMIRN